MRKPGSPSGEAETRPGRPAGDEQAEHKKAAGRLDRQLAIGAELRKAFEGVASEEAPPRLKALAEKLDRELGRKSGD